MNYQTTCKPIKEAREKIHLHGSDKTIGIIGPSKDATGCSALMLKASLVAAQTDPRTSYSVKAVWTEIFSQPPNRSFKNPFFFCANRTITHQTLKD